MRDESKSILVVEDDAGQRGILEGFLRRRGYRIHSASNAEAALDFLEGNSPDVVLMDVRMPGMGGLKGLERMRELSPTLPVILLTAYAEVRDAVEAMRHGALDYLEKPVDLEELSIVITEAIGGASGAEQVKLPPLPDGFIVSSDAMRRSVNEASLVAPTEATVLITGESGTGKERVAEFIHLQSPRRQGPLIRVNCAAIPENLVESELFGHKKGAFTGAEANRLGRFEAAAGGTILLDEVGELPLHIQPKLLRVLEGGSFERVGESETKITDARVIACTNRDLEREVARGAFREDLFWRLNVFRIHLPSLKERREEIPLLVRSFLARLGRGKARLSPAACRVLESYDWPGNIRELANVIERAAILAAGDVILPENLPDSLRRGAPGNRKEAPGTNSPLEEKEQGTGEAPGSFTVEEAERHAIREALNRTGGNRTRAAKLLGISRRTLLYRLKKYGGEP